MGCIRRAIVVMDRGPLGNLLLANKLRYLRSVIVAGFDVITTILGNQLDVNAGDSPGFD